MFLYALRVLCGEKVFAGALNNRDRESQFSLL
jgi:hypothetical protein